MSVRGSLSWTSRRLSSAPTGIGRTTCSGAGGFRHGSAPPRSRSTLRGRSGTGAPMGGRPRRRRPFHRRAGAHLCGQLALLAFSAAGQAAGLAVELQSSAGVDFPDRNGAHSRAAATGATVRTHCGGWRVSGVPHALVVDALGSMAPAATPWVIPCRCRMNTYVVPQTSQQQRALDAGPVVRLLTPRRRRGHVAGGRGAHRGPAGPTRRAARRTCPLSHLKCLCASLRRLPCGLHAPPARRCAAARSLHGPRSRGEPLGATVDGPRPRGPIRSARRRPLLRGPTGGAARRPRSARAGHRPTLARRPVGWPHTGTHVARACQHLCRPLVGASLPILRDLYAAWSFRTHTAEVAGWLLARSARHG